MRTCGESDAIMTLGAALITIAQIGCMQKADEEEFFCKKDGSGHSCYCPAGIAEEALKAIGYELKKGNSGP